MSSRLLWADDLDAPLAWRQGRAISRRQFLADAQALAPLLPADGRMLNTSADRYRFAVGLGAALLRGQPNLMPPNHTPDTVARLRELFPQAYGLFDDPERLVGLPMLWHEPAHADAEALAIVQQTPQIADETLAAAVLTSGSTGAPVPHAKHWGGLVRNTRAGAQRLAEHMGRDDLAGVSLVATVPAQHMYGFESTVLVAMLAGAAFDTDRPFYPADIARALERLPRPRMLVTTPFHLKALLDAGVALPAIDLTVCATAPLPPQLAARAEAALSAPLMEIYGCTEAGQVATRRPTAGPEWRVYDGLQLSGDGAATVVSGGHVPEPVTLADVLEVVDAQTFRLLGRSNDLVNIAGKRSSLSHLNHHLNSIPGVNDGAFWLPSEDGASVVRLTAFVVAPELAAADILTALRQRIDAAFLPRPIVFVESLPREATGKLPAMAFAAWAAQRGTPPHHNPLPLMPEREFRSDAATLALDIPVDHPAFAGHFPGAPLVPGALLLALVLEAVLADAVTAALVGPRPRVAAVKFLSPLRPGDAAALQLFAEARGLRFEVRSDERLVASGQFEVIAPADAA